MRSNILNERVVVPKILVYQSDYCDLLLDSLKQNGYNVVEASKSNILLKLREKDYDMCILDHWLFDEDKPLKLLEFLRRSDTRTPVILISKSQAYADIIKAFDFGVDDYITCPYNLNEVIRRVRAIMRRCGIRVNSIKSEYKIGDYNFIPSDKKLNYKGSEVILANIISKVLALLCEYKNQVLTTEFIVRHIWREPSAKDKKRVLHVYACKLREYLQMDKTIQLEVIANTGYILRVPEKETEETEE